MRRPLFYCMFKEATMQNSKHDQRVRVSLQRFQKSGETIRIVGKANYERATSIQCGLCGWPKTSETANARGLAHIFIVKNLTTNQEIFVGSECIQKLQEYLQENNGNQDIQNLDLINSQVENYDERYNQTPEITGNVYNNNQNIGLESEYFKERNEIIQTLRSEKSFQYYYGDDEIEDSEVQNFYGDDEIEDSEA